MLSTLKEDNDPCERSNVYEVSEQASLQLQSPKSAAVNNRWIIYCYSKNYAAYTDRFEIFCHRKVYLQQPKFGNFAKKHIDVNPKECEYFYRSDYVLSYTLRWNISLQGPLLLTWFNFNPSMDKWIHPL